MKRGIAVLMVLMLVLAFGSAAWPSQTSAPPDGSQRVAPAQFRLDDDAAQVVAQESGPVAGRRLPAAAAGWSDLFTETFEGDFPGTRWTRLGNPTWGKTSFRRHTGSYGAYIFAGGTNAVAPPGPYPNYKTTWMISGPYDLSQASDAELAFHHWTRSEFTSDFKHDHLCTLASIDGETFNGECYYGDFTALPGNVQGWVPAVFDLTDVPNVGNLAGKARVWVAFVFQSDITIQAEGSYVDDAALRVYTGPTPTPTMTPTPASSCPGASQSSYLTTNDNENNALTSQPDNDMYVADPPLCIFRTDSKAPIEFRIFANNPPGVINKAQLNLRVDDVDEQNTECAEVDTVLFNGSNVGKLTGADMQWSTTALSIAPALVQPGGNLVQVQINTLNCPNPLDPADPQGRWCTSVDWGELVLEGGQGAASIREASTDVACYVPGSIIHLKVEADTSMASQEVRTEVNVLDANDVNLVGRTQVKTIYGIQNDAFLFDLPLPADATLGEHRLQIITTDKCSETQNAYRELPLVIGLSCGTPTTTPTPTRTPTRTPTPATSHTPTATATLTAPTAVKIYLPLVVHAEP